MMVADDGHKLSRSAAKTGGAVVRWADRVLIVLVVGLAAIYVAAKVHFFRRFAEMPVEDYLSEHWPFWAAALVLALLANVIGRIRDARMKGQSNDEMQRTRHG